MTWWFRSLNCDSVHYFPTPYIYLRLKFLIAWLYLSIDSIQLFVRAKINLWLWITLQHISLRRQELLCDFYISLGLRRFFPNSVIYFWLFVDSPWRRTFLCDVVNLCIECKLLWDSESDFVTWKGSLWRRSFLCDSVTVDVLRLNVSLCAHTFLEHIHR